jgi:hypothetical protein
MENFKYKEEALPFITYDEVSQSISFLLIKRLQNSPRSSDFHIITAQKFGCDYGCRDVPNWKIVFAKLNVSEQK